MIIYFRNGLYARSLDYLSPLSLFILTMQYARDSCIHILIVSITARQTHFSVTLAAHHIPTNSRSKHPPLSEFPTVRFISSSYFSLFLLFFSLLNFIETLVLTSLRREMSYNRFQRISPSQTSWICQKSQLFVEGELLERSKFVKCNCLLLIYSNYSSNFFNLLC